MGLTDNQRTLGLRHGAVTVESADLHVSTIHGSELFWRLLTFADFDVAEMSIATLVILQDRARASGEEIPWVALPVFTSRRFFHTTIWKRHDSGINRPEDLVGKRVGVPEYQQTAAVWARGVLADEFSVNPQQVHWFMERSAELSHGGATDFSPPPGVDLQVIERPASIGSMLVSGELDATVLYLNARNLVDRSRVVLEDQPEVGMLFDPPAEARRYYESTGLHPINHCVVIRRDLVVQHPWLVLNVYSAFCESRDLAGRSFRDLLREPVAAGFIDAGAAATLSRERYIYGLAGNRRELETVLRYLHEQGLIALPTTPEEVFDERTHAF